MSQNIKFCMLMLLVLVGVVPLRADIAWLEKNYNYGAFKESDGPQKGSVRFVNKGDEAIFINRVRPGCGCTEANYTQGLIAPGDTATVSFIYNPKGRPGSFDKSIKVYVGKDNELHVVRIRGTVIGSSSTLEFSYPKEVGPLRLESFAVKTGELKKGSSRHLFINAYNQSSDTIRPTWVCDERGLQVELTPRNIPPGDIATFGFYLKTSDEERMGPIDYKILLTADTAQHDNESCELTVSTIIVPDTRAMTTEEVNNGPRAYLLPEFVDLGETNEKGKTDFSFEILNDGESALEVIRVYSADKCVHIKDRPSKIKPGKRSKVKGSLDMKGVASGAFRISLEVMTNDPLHPLRIVNLVGIKP